MAGIPMAELMAQAHGCQDAWLQHLVKHKEEALLRKYAAHCQRKMAKHVRGRHGGMAGFGQRACARCGAINCACGCAGDPARCTCRAAPGMSGLGFAPTRGAGIPTQYQRVEAAPAWAKGLPQQSIAEGYRFAFPATESAFLDRSATIRGGHGGAFTGQVRRGAPRPAYSQLPTYRGPSPYVQQNVWTNPWTAQQWFTGAAGIPIWGGGYTQPFRSPAGRGGAVAPVGNTAGQFPAVGASFERF